MDSDVMARSLVAYAVLFFGEVDVSDAVVLVDVKPVTCSSLVTRD